MATSNVVERPAYKYEGVVIMHPDATDAEQKALFTKNKQIIGSFKGNIANLDTWGKRKLMNPIEKLKMGAYFHYQFEGKAGVIAELERTMKINERVLRFLHVRLDDRVAMTKHVEDFRTVLQGSRERDQEREAKIQAKKAFNRERKPFRDGPGGR